MRTLKQINDEISKLQAKYVSLREGKKPEDEWMPVSDQIKALKKELSSTISDGAEPCPDCGTLPHGMLLRPAVLSEKRPATYEVGCLVCRNHRAIGWTPELAVEAWNNGDYLPPT